MKAIVCIGAAVLALAVAAPAHAAESCSATAVPSPDGTSLSILFDEMTVESGADTVATCTISAPLNLPEGQSLGVYRVDYRGYAHLEKKATATLNVDYALGPKGNGRAFKRSVRGETDEDFIFSENIGAGLMKRVGCGVDAVLNVSVSLELKGGEASLATLDSSDGTSRHGLVYHFNLQKCR